MILSEHRAKRSCVIDFTSQAAETPKLELLHQPFPNRPHARSFAIDVHRNGEQQKAQLDASQGEEHGARAVGFHPINGEEREHQAVEDVY